MLNYNRYSITVAYERLKHQQYDERVASCRLQPTNAVGLLQILSKIACQALPQTTEILGPTLCNIRLCYVLCVTVSTLLYCIFCVQYRIAIDRKPILDSYEFQSGLVLVTARMLSAQRQSGNCCAHRAGVATRNQLSKQI